MRVLIVEDERELAAVIARVLDRSGFAVDLRGRTACELEPAVTPRRGGGT
jgi:DNA-binding response OmpR family regulator